MKPCKSDVRHLPFRVSIHRHPRSVAKACIYPGITYNLCSYLGLHERRPPSRAARMSPVEMREADLAFWIGFCNEKMACAMSSWPSSYREEDITAFLPTCPGANVSWKVGETLTRLLMVWCLFKGTILATDSMAWHVSEFHVRALASF
jgi:hypothetical protein